MSEKLEFTQARRVALVGIPDPGMPGEGEVLVESLYSGISAGTEMAFFSGSAPHFTKQIDLVQRLMVDADESYFSYPLSYGYENVGMVTEIGPGVSGISAGDIVCSYTGHVSKFVIAESNAFVLPEGMDPRYGVFMPLLGVAYKNILTAKILLGETVVIVGLGVVGQLLVQLARLCGAGQVIAIDYLDSRLETAQGCGADRMLNPVAAGDVAVAVRELTDGRGADVVFECSGSTRALHQAIRIVYPSGPVFATSFYRGEAAGLYLGEEFHHFQGKIICSGGIPGDVHPRWDEGRWQKAVNSLLPRLQYGSLVSHTFPLEEAQNAYELVADHPEETMKVVFSYKD